MAFSSLPFDPFRITCNGSLITFPVACSALIEKKAKPVTNNGELSISLIAELFRQLLSDKSIHDDVKEWFYASALMNGQRVRFNSCEEVLEAFSSRSPVFTQYNQEVSLSIFINKVNNLIQAFVDQFSKPKTADRTSSKPVEQMPSLGPTIKKSSVKPASTLPEVTRKAVIADVTGKSSSTPADTADDEAEAMQSDSFAYFVSRQSNLLVLSSIRDKIPKLDIYKISFNSKSVFKLKIPSSLAPQLKQELTERNICFNQLERDSQLRIYGFQSKSHATQWCAGLVKAGKILFARIISSLKSTEKKVSYGLLATFPTQQQALTFACTQKYCHLKGTNYKLFCTGPSDKNPIYRKIVELPFARLSTFKICDALKKLKDFPKVFSIRLNTDRSLAWLCSFERFPNENEIIFGSNIPSGTLRNPFSKKESEDSTAMDDGQPQQPKQLRKVDCLIGMHNALSLLGSKHKKNPTNSTNKQSRGNNRYSALSDNPDIAAAPTTTTHSQQSIPATAAATPNKPKSKRSKATQLASKPRNKPAKQPQKDAQQTSAKPTTTQADQHRTEPLTATLDRAPDNLIDIISRLLNEINSAQSMMKATIQASLATFEQIASALQQTIASLRVTRVD